MAQQSYALELVTKCFSYVYRPISWTPFATCILNMEMTPAALYGIITFQLHTIYIHTSENEEHHIACFYQMWFSFKIYRVWAHHFGD